MPEHDISASFSDDEENGQFSNIFSPNNRTKYKSPNSNKSLRSSDHCLNSPNNLQPRSESLGIHYSEEKLLRVGGGYTQGMSVLCAPFLYEMPEVDAFFCFNLLLTKHIPQYVNSSLDGVLTGCSLISRVLEVVDPELFHHLDGTNHEHLMYFGFSFVMSLHACMQPLEEILKIWDVLFAYGVHLEILIVVAQCVLLREKLLADHKNPFTFLTLKSLQLQPFDAEILVACAFSLIPHIHQDLLDEIACHPIVSLDANGFR
eukprot:CAMPEP_0171459298 /NCGR_PEP_ID=MMETSP0945-20130129/4638_1 /TAXON_ID=109269 /ORGANISM="Vaucheria litorea, Strain CCMP2940" /LENGTH=259 /DNA_ID=CAMNT_0011985289 /DNA_START=159 /DNA_END=935 /DNA_ORIENTATION=-